MGKYLTYEEKMEIHKLSATGKTREQLAKMFGRHVNTIDHTLTKDPRKAKPIPKGLPFSELEEMDFSMLSDEVLFEHDSSYVFNF